MIGSEIINNYSYFSNSQLIKNTKNSRMIIISFQIGNFFLFSDSLYRSDCWHEAGTACTIYTRQDKSSYQVKGLSSVFCGTIANTVSQYKD